MLSFDNESLLYNFKFDIRARFMEAEQINAIDEQLRDLDKRVIELRRFL